MSLVTDSWRPRVKIGNWKGKGNIGVGGWSGWGRNEKMGQVRDGGCSAIVFPY